MKLVVEAQKARSYTKRLVPIEAFHDDEMSSRIAPLAKGKMRSNNKTHYYLIFLWETQDDYERAAGVTSSGTIALCVTDTYVCEDTGAGRVVPELGALHFVSGSWNVNDVAHEVQHAILHRMRYLDPLPPLVLDELQPSWDQDDEEVIAYEAGAWVESALAWLTNNDPRSPYPAKLFDR